MVGKLLGFVTRGAGARGGEVVSESKNVLELKEGSLVSCLIKPGYCTTNRCASRARTHRHMSIIPSYGCMKGKGVSSPPSKEPLPPQRRPLGRCMTSSQNSRAHILRLNFVTESHLGRVGETSTSATGSGGMPAKVQALVRAVGPYHGEVISSGRDTTIQKPRVGRVVQWAAGLAVSTESHVTAGGSWKLGRSPVDAPRFPTPAQGAAGKP